MLWGSQHSILQTFESTGSWLSAPDMTYADYQEQANNLLAEDEHQICAQLSGDDDGFCLAGIEFRAEFPYPALVLRRCDSQGIGAGLIAGNRSRARSASSAYTAEGTTTCP